MTGTPSSRARASSGCVLGSADVTTTARAPSTCAGSWPVLHGDPESTEIAGDPPDRVAARRRDAADARTARRARSCRRRRCRRSERGGVGRGRRGDDLDVGSRRAPRAVVATKTDLLSKLQVGFEQSAASVSAGRQVERVLRGGDRGERRRGAPTSSRTRASEPIDGELALRTRPRRAGRGERAARCRLMVGGGRRKRDQDRGNPPRRTARRSSSRPLA